MDKTIQDHKMEIKTIEKSQKETALEIENLGKRSGIIDASITNRIQEIEERISGTEITIENIDMIVKKCNKIITQNIQNTGQNEKSKTNNNRYRIE